MFGWTVGNQQSNRWTDGDNVTLRNMIFSQKTKRGRHTDILFYYYIRYTRTYLNPRIIWEAAHANHSITFLMSPNPIFEMFNIANGLQNKTITKTNLDK